MEDPYLLTEVDIEEIKTYLFWVSLFYFFFIIFQSDNNIYLYIKRLLDNMYLTLKHFQNVHKCSRHTDVIKIMFTGERIKIYAINSYGAGKYNSYTRTYS